MTKQGLFLTFEGLDGSGKTTQMRRFAERLRAMGELVLETVEPGGTAIGRHIRQILLDPAHKHLDPRAELLLYFAARAQNLAECIEPALGEGRIVLADRYTDSTLAYQGEARQLGWDVVRQIHRFACRDRNPDLTFYIDIDPAYSVERALTRNRDQQIHAESRLDEESTAFHMSVHRGYERLADTEPQRFRRINGRGSIEEVEGRVWEVYKEFRQTHV